MVEAEKVEEPEFRWGRKSRTGGKKKDIQFYESFTYDDVEYVRYDSVYLYEEGEEEPSIGKLIKMWETSDKKKKGKVLWFFQPSEISNFIGDKETLDNELFLASGEGSGLANINPLEAIAGKCNVICFSKDSRNRQPIYEEIKNAEFVFRRTFDVGCCKIKDEIDNKIAGTDVKFLLNREDAGGGCSTLKVDLGRKDDGENAVHNNSRVVTSVGNISKECATVNSNGYHIDTATDEAAVLNDLSSKPESSTARKTASDICVELGNTAKTNQTKDDVSGHKALSSSKVESKNNEDKASKNSEDKAGKVLVRQVKSEGRVKRSQESVELDDKLSKKAKLSSENVDKSKNGIQQTKLGSDASVEETFAPTASAFDDKDEVKPSKDSSEAEKGPAKKLKLGNKTTELSNGKLLKVSTQQAHGEDHKKEGQQTEGTPKPDADRSKWFSGRPWEDRISIAHEKGKLVLLQNLDPSYTSAEVEDIVRQGFKESCSAKMIQRTMFSSPRSGQAFVIFERKDIAEMVVERLGESCLLLPNGRPLVGRIVTPCLPEKKPTFSGHLCIEKLRYQMQREQRDAVSTSHCSQPNTLEYDMALEWFLLQQKSDLEWKKLYEKQGQDLRKLKAQLNAR